MTNKQKVKPAHARKLADNQHTIAKHHRRGYENRKLVAMGFKNPRTLKKEAYVAKMTEQIREYKKVKDELQSNK